MLRNSIRARTSLNVAQAIRRNFSTSDWEGVHGYTGDTKLPFNSWQPPPPPPSSTQNSTKSAILSQELKKEVKKDEKKTVVELKDEELKSKLEGISGEGGGAGVQLEDGKAVGLKRGVRRTCLGLFDWDKTPYVHECLRRLGRSEEKRRKGSGDP